MAVLYALALAAQTIAFLVFLFYYSASQADERRRLVNELLSRDVGELAIRSRVTGDETARAERPERRPVAPFGL